MKMKLLIIFLIIFCVASCKNEQEERFKKSIRGEWLFVRVGTDNTKKTKKKKQDTPSVLLGENRNYRKGYIFYSNNSCEDKRGYFKFTKRQSRYERITLFQGTDTKYKVEDDILKIYSLSDSTWERIKIRSISPDTLTLGINDSVYIKYARVHYKIDRKQTFDMIVVSTSACYGSCPISSTSIDKQGNFIFLGQGYNSKTGLFTSKIGQDFYHRIELNFKKANIDKLDVNYSASWTDDQTVTVTFIKDNKIYKTITDYGFKAPRELYWAYISMSFLYQKLDLKPLITNAKELLSITPACFENKGKICELARSERFYLSTELIKGKILKHNFTKKYILKYRNDNDSLKTIVTDGRYYQLRIKEKVITIDLGYNFVIKNNLFKKFRKKTEYD